MTYPLENIKTKRVPSSFLLGPELGGHMQHHANDVATIYRGIVAKRTGRLAGSTHAFVTIGGHKNDRLIGKVVVGTGLEYAALHEFGAKSNAQRQAARDLAEAVALWKGARRT